MPLGYVSVSLVAAKLYLFNGLAIKRLSVPYSVTLHICEGGLLEKVKRMLSFAAT